MEAVIGEEEGGEEARLGTPIHLAVTFLCPAVRGRPHESTLDA